MKNPLMPKDYNNAQTPQTEYVLPERYGNRKVPKMIKEISIFQQLVMAEGTPAIQEQWDRIVAFIDFLPQEVARRERPL